MKILVTGASGLVGSRFIELHSKTDELLSPDLDVFDILNPQSLKDYFVQNNPDVVIHFAAYTDVGEAEKQRDNKNGFCWKINVDGTRNLLQALDLRHVFFVHISTDMVFSGIAGPYGESELPETDSPKVNWYGFTKAEAERVIQNELSGKATILRLINPVRAKYELKLDYLRKPLKMFDEHTLLPLFFDQQISISFVDEICQALDLIILKKAVGTFHTSSSNTSTPLDLVTHLLQKIRNLKEPLKSWSIEEYFKSGGSRVRYPKFGGLRVEETEKRLGIKFSTCEEIINKLVAQNINY